MNSVNAKIKRQAERLSKDLMKDFTSLVAPLPNNRTFRFIPTYISNPQQVIDNYIKAEQR
ncbi:MAG: hypothetical protein LBG59_07845 [Candidatus Peribacteria bacterium]|jgi:hypothetical protein|nr:hypothetical protein [Candidatus Peribacteria bacterium]